ncbi:M48 family metalloprotease [Fretibacter rubidus]|uniref:M48 family metalloprotease n=1 Tax=Fretibacter rubidus TaxID=570162 RepID=UPI00352B511E
MMMRGLICTAALALLGCDVGVDANAGDAPSDSPTIALETPIYTAPDARPDNTQFIDVLEQYQALNARLDSVAVRLQRANAALCPVTVRDVGYTVHSVGDYPQNLREVARSLLNVSEALSIRTVRKGSTADTAGLKPGDRLVGINGQRLAAGMTQKLFYERAARRAFDEKTASVTTARGEELRTKTLRPETLCGYPVNVFFNEGINGHTDGEAVWVTSELMRTVADDVNLSLIVAHEMAHAIAGHMAQEPDKSLELLADRMALVMMARAGLDIDRAVAYWDDAVHPHADLQERSFTHPSIAERRDNLTDMAVRIKKAQADGLDLDFSLSD